MNGRERIANAMRHLPTDRTPVFCQLSFGHYLLNTGLPPHQVLYNSEVFAEAVVRLQRRYSFDGVLLNVPGRRPDLLSDVLRIESTPEGEILSWRNGDLGVAPWNDNMHHYAPGKTALARADFATFDPEQLDRVDEYPGYTFNTYHVPYLPEKAPGLLKEVPESFLATIDLVRAEIGGEISVHGEVFSPFTHFMELFGYQEALMGLITDPAKAHAFLERLTEASIAWGVAQAQRGVDAVLNSSAFAGGGFISRKMYQEFVLPYELRLTRAIQAASAPVYTHTCGKIGDRLDLMAATGIDGLDTLDPPPLGNADLAEAKQSIGKQVFLKGNMNPVLLLEAKSRQQVLSEVNRCLDAAAEGSGYILSTACSVSPQVEPWKLEMLVPHVEAYTPVWRR